MTQLSSRLSAVLMTALSLALPLASPLRAQIIDLPVVDPPENGWSLNPGTVTAGAEFNLQILSYSYSCAHTYANKQVVVNQNQIDLTFSSTINPAVLCLAIERPYGPTFKMPALKPGRYAVYANLLQPCHVDTPVCRMAIPREPAGTLTVSEEGKISYVVSPTSVVAGKEFTLELLSPQFTCNLDYLRTSSRVQDGKITLTFLDKANPLVLCAPEAKLYGPAYKLAGLNAGTYEVWAERLPACVEEGCKVLPVPELAGKLSVSSDLPARRGWFLNPKEIKSGSTFSLNLVNHDYGSCNTEFANGSVVVQNNAINVSFSIINHPDRVCIWDKRPHGPSFTMNAMKPGRYPVTVQVMPACFFSEPRCMLAIPDTVTSPSDTLVVSQTVVGLTPSSSGTRSGALAAWRGQALEVRLPDGAQGLWRAEVVSLSGKRLLSAPVDAASGMASLALGGVERGLVMVRLVSPERETHTLRVPVND